MVSETRQKASLRFWNPDNIEYNVCNQVWACAGSDKVSVHKANIHVQLVSGTYILQRTRLDLTNTKLGCVHFVVMNLKT